MCYVPTQATKEVAIGTLGTTRPRRVRVNITISPVILKKIDAIARERDLPRSMIINMILREHFAEQRTQEGNA